MDARIAGGTGGGLLGAESERESVTRGGITSPPVRRLEASSAACSTDRPKPRGLVPASMFVSGHLLPMKHGGRLSFRHTEIIGWTSRNASVFDLMSFSRKGSRWWRQGTSDMRLESGFIPDFCTEHPSSWRLSVETGHGHVSDDERLQ